MFHLIRLTKVTSMPISQICSPQCRFLGLLWGKSPRLRRAIEAIALMVSLMLPFRLVCAEPAGTLRVGVDPTLPPMVFKENKKLAGIEADLAHVLAQDL